MRVNRNVTMPRGRKATMVPQQASKKSNGMVAGTLAVG